MYEVYTSVPTIDLKNHELPAEAAQQEERAADLDLQNASDIVLTLGQTNFAQILRPIEVELELINAGQKLIDDSLAASVCLPHGDVAHGMPRDDEVVHFTQTVHRMVLIDVGNVRVVQSILDLGQKVVARRLRCYFISGPLLIDHRRVAVLLTVVVHNSIARHYNVAILIH